MLTGAEGIHEARKNLCAASLSQWHFAGTNRSKYGYASNRGQLFLRPDYSTPLVLLCRLNWKGIFLGIDKTVTKTQA